MRASFAVAISTSAALLISGCTGIHFGPNTQTVTTQGAALQGRVHGGQNPIVGANVYLYAANATGYGNASVSLLSSPGYVTTDSNGAFTITGDYACPSSNSQVYLYAIGGNPGSGANSSVGLLAGLGPCGSLTSSTYIVINEVSTIATAYAIAGYATDATHVSSSGSALAQTGIANAFATITNLETLGTGTALATTPAANGGNATAPQGEINTLANILAACINSTGAITGPTNPTPCYTLFTTAMSGGSTGTQPTDTATAAINIAHNPACYLGFQVCSLIALQTANSPFQPQLTAAPNDFTVAVIYDTLGGIIGGIISTQGLAIDGSGDVWFADGDDDNVGELNPAGKLLSGSSGYVGGGLTNPGSVAIDAAGNVWATNTAGPASISELNSSGAAISGSSGYTGGGLLFPTEIAIDTGGDAWVTNPSTNSLSEFNPGGSPVTGSSGYTGGGLGIPGGIAIDVSGNVWVANSKRNAGISEFSSAGSPISGSTAFGGGAMGNIDQALTIALDGAGNIWVTDSVQSIAELGPNGAELSPGIGYMGGGIDNPVGIAIDGSENVWVTNFTASSISELNSSGATISPAYFGYEAGERYVPNAIAIDGSGNVWVGGSAIIEYVGAATPVVTPIVANLKSPYGQHAVNEP
jgi:streptogramin lyase